MPQARAAAASTSVFWVPEEILTMFKRMCDMHEDLIRRHNAVVAKQDQISDHVLHLEEQLLEFLKSKSTSSASVNAHALDRNPVEVSHSVVKTLSEPLMQEKSSRGC